MTTTHRIATGIVATLALATAAPASATPWDPNSRDPSIAIRPGSKPGMITPAPTRADKGPVVLQLTTERSRFDWADAGIGAAAGLGFSALTIGGSLVLVGKRRNRSYATAR